MYFEENIKLTDEQKVYLLGLVQTSFEFYKTQLEQPRQRMLEVFENTFVFKFDRGNGRASLFFPKLYEHLQRIAPRLVSNEPKWVITPLVMTREEIPEDIDMMGMAKLNESQRTIFDEAEKAQLYLNYIWNLGRCQEKLDSWSVNGLVQNIGWAKVDFVQKTKKRKTEMPDGSIKEVETILMEYPTFEVLDPLSMYFDPRIEFIEDMPSIIQLEEKVFTKDILQNKDLYYPEAIDWLKQVGNQTNNVVDSKQTMRFTSQGVPFGLDNSNPSISKKCFWGYVKLDDEEKLVYMTIGNDTEILECKEIPFYPLEKWSPSKIPNQAMGVGALSPVLDLHKAYNLLRNQRFDNTSLVINRMWLMRRGAGVDPRKLKSFAGNIIDVPDFDAVRPLDTPDITSSAYNEATSLNTDMQTATGTIDATQDQGSNGFTNLATGQKIRYAEFSSRFKYYKSNLERALAKLGQKMLVMTAYRAKQNPVVLDRATNEFYRLSKDLFDSFDDFFEVSILADSTTFDSVYNQRDEALAQAKISLEYKNAGVPVDLTKQYMNVMKTFPGTNPEELIEKGMPMQGQGGSLSPQDVAGVLPPMTESEQLTESITSNIGNV